MSISMDRAGVYHVCPPPTQNNIHMNTVSIVALSGRMHQQRPTYAVVSRGTICTDESVGNENETKTKP